MKKIILIVVSITLIFSQLVLAAESGTESTPIRTVIIPFQNATGDSRLDWISIGLQDAMTIDLWYIKRFDMDSLVKMPSLEDLNNIELKDLIEYGKKEMLDQIWIGQYEGNAKDITVEISVLDVNTEQILAERKFTCKLEDLLSESSRNILKLANELGANVDEDEASRVLSFKTASLEAWRLNTDGYKYSRTYSDEVDEDKKTEIKEKWQNALEESVAADPWYAEAWNNLGWMYADTQQYEKAEKAFENALMIKAFLINAHIGMGYVHEDLYEYQNAFEHYKIAIDLNPYSDISLSYLPRVLAKLGNKDEALQLALNLLKSRSAFARYNAARALYEIKDKRAVQSLLEALKDVDKYVRHWAIAALEVIGDLKAVPALIESLQDPEQIVRSNAVDALGSIGEKSAVPALIGALNDRDKKVRSAAIKAIGKIGNKETLTALVETLKRKPDRQIQEEIVAAFGEIRSKSTIPILIELVNNSDGTLHEAAAKAMGRIGDKRAVPFLVSFLKNPDRNIRIAAVDALGSINDKDIIPPLTEALNDPEKDIREAALWGIYNLLKSADFNAEEKYTALPWIEFLSDPIKERRIAGIYYYAKKHSKSAEKYLIEMLKDTDESIRCDAAEALGEIGDKETVPALIEALNQGDEGLRKCAVKALGKIGGNSAADALFELVSKDTSKKLSRIIMNAFSDLIKNIRAAELSSKLKDPNKNIRIIAALMLGEIKDSEAEILFLDLLNDPDVCVRFVSGFSLGKLGNKTVVPLLKEASRYPDTIVDCLNRDSLFEVTAKDVRIAVIESLKIVGDSESLIEFISDNDKYVREEAAEALMAIGDKTAIPVLIEALKDPDEEMRYKAIKALGNIKEESIEPAIAESLKDVSSEVREEAVKSLVRYGNASALYNVLIETADVFYFNAIRKNILFLDDYAPLNKQPESIFKNVRLLPSLPQIPQRREIQRPA